MKDFTKRIFDEVIEYEKYWAKKKNSVISVDKILSYFGAENICKLYGCTVVDEEIAKILIVKEFEK